MNKKNEIYVYQKSTKDAVFKDLEHDRLIHPEHWDYEQDDSIKRHKDDEVLAAGSLKIDASERITAIQDSTLYQTSIYGASQLFRQLGSMNVDLEHVVVVTQDNLSQSSSRIQSTPYDEGNPLGKEYFQTPAKAISDVLEVFKSNLDVMKERVTQYQDSGLTAFYKFVNGTLTNKRLEIAKEFNIIS